MKNAHWRSSCSPVWPAPACDWLRTVGSLTLRLQHSHGQFKVVLLHQGMSPALADERGLLVKKGLQRVRSRDVCLWAGGEPRVFAHSVVAWLGPQSDWPFWRHLGSRSLGSVLFRDHQVKRVCMQVAKLSPRHALARRASQALALAGQQFAGVPFYARRAVYVRGARRTPLVVTEVFLNWDPGQVRRLSWKG